jgi:hypothetical protein
MKPNMYCGFKHCGLYYDHNHTLQEVENFQHSNKLMKKVPSDTMFAQTLILIAAMFLVGYWVVEGNAGFLHLGFWSTMIWAIWDNRTNKKIREETDGSKTSNP